MSTGGASADAIPLHFVPQLDFWECVDWIFPGTLLYFEMRRLQKADSSG